LWSTSSIRILSGLYLSPAFSILPTLPTISYFICTFSTNVSKISQTLFFVSFVISFGFHIGFNSRRRICLHCRMQYELTRRTSARTCPIRLQLVFAMLDLMGDLESKLAYIGYFSNCFIAFLHFCLPVHQVEFSNDKPCITDYRCEALFVNAKLHGPAASEFFIGLHNKLQKQNRPTKQLLKQLFDKLDFGFRISIVLMNGDVKQKS